MDTAGGIDIVPGRIGEVIRIWLEIVVTEMNGSGRTVLPRIDELLGFVIVAVPFRLCDSDDERR